MSLLTPFMTNIMFCFIGTNVYSKNRAEWEGIAILPIFYNFFSISFKYPYNVGRLICNSFAILVSE